MTKDASAIQEYVESVLSPWQSEDGTVFVDYVGQNGEIKTMKPNQKIDSEFYNWVVATCYRKFKYCPSKILIENLTAYMKFKGQEEGVIKKTAVRMTGDMNGLYVDMADSLNRIIKVTPGKIEVLMEPPKEFRFMRSKGMQAVPTPKVNPDGRILTYYLKKYIDAPEGDICLLASWLVGCYRPKGPYPILILTGEQGSGKSTTARFLRRLVDPHSFDLREPFEDRKDLIAAAKNSFVLAFDNVSYIRNWFSDQLCRISTGTAALGGRALYTDDEETATVACRPVILNGIPEFAERGDLLDRALQIHMPAISPKKRRDDDEYWAAFEEDYPFILHCILECAQEAMTKYATVKLAEKPRMSAFATWVVAAEGQLGWRKGMFIDAYKLNRDVAESKLLELNSLASVMMRFMEKKSHFAGTYDELVGEMIRYIGPKEILPNTTQGIVSEMKRIAPLLKRSNIYVKPIGRKTTGSVGKGRSMVEIKKYEMGHVEDETTQEAIEEVLSDGARAEIL